MLKTLALATLLLATPAFAQTPMHHDTPHGMPMPTPAPDTQANKAFQAAMDRMMADMHPPSGNPDHDFVAGMIPHHQGAIDMAQAELQYGNDPVLKRLAREIIRAQKKEIAFMHQWQQKHPSGKPAP